MPPSATGTDADSYAAADPWSNMVGAALNGAWELRITDLWPEDNGYIFSWSMTWDPASVSTCEGPVIL
jgi:subtilisin-like proprotein convertase family protein